MNLKRLPRGAALRQRAALRHLLKWAAGSAKAVVPRQRTAGCGAQAGDNRDNNPFLLHVVVHALHGVKAKVPFTQFLLNHG